MMLRDIVAVFVLAIVLSSHSPAYPAERALTNGSKPTQSHGSDRTVPNPGQYQG